MAAAIALMVGYNRIGRRLLSLPVSHRTHSGQKLEISPLIGVGRPATEGREPREHQRIPCKYKKKKRKKDGTPADNQLTRDGLICDRNKFGEKRRLSAGQWKRERGELFGEE